MNARADEDAIPISRTWFREIDSLKFSEMIKEIIKPNGTTCVVASATDSKTLREILKSTKGLQVRHIKLNQGWDISPLSFGKSYSKDEVQSEL
jgi:hypothetical protein